MKFKLILFISVLTTSSIWSQNQRDLYQIIDAISAHRIKSDIRTLVDFGTRHTLSDTVSKTRGIGAATMAKK